MFVFLVWHGVLTARDGWTWFLGLEVFWFDFDFNVTVIRMYLTGGESVVIEYGVLHNVHLPI